MNRFVIWVLNIVAGIFFFFFFLFLYFPFEPIVSHFLAKVETESKGNYRITVGEIKPSLLFKSKFTDFQIHKMENGISHVLVDFSEIKIGVSYLPLLAGQVQASFEAKAKKGFMEGDVYLSSTEYRVDTDIDGMSFSTFPYLNELVGTTLLGTLKGSVKLKLDPEQINRDEGDIDLSIADFIIPASKITPTPGFDLDLPETMLSDKNGGKIALSLSRGRVEIKTFEFPGPDLALSLKGRLQLNKKSNLSRLSINGNFKISEKIKEALPLIVVVDKQKGEDGSYPITLSGNISKPKVQIGTFEVL